MSNRHTDRHGNYCNPHHTGGYTCVYNVQLKTFTNFAGFRILQNFWGEIYNAVVGMHMCLQACESVRRYPSNAPLCMTLRPFMKLFYKMLLHGVL